MWDLQRFMSQRQRPWPPGFFSSMAMVVPEVALGLRILFQTRLLPTSREGNSLRMDLELLEQKVFCSRVSGCHKPHLDRHLRLASLALRTLDSGRAMRGRVSKRCARVWIIRVDSRHGTQIHHLPKSSVVKHISPT